MRLVNRPSPRVFIAVLVVVGVAVARPSGQERATQAAGDPVTVEFRALTSGGSPVTDLKASEVVLRVAGRERPIDRLQLFQFSESALAPAIPPPFATNVLPATGVHDTILVIDDQSVTPGDAKRLGPAVDQYLAGLAKSARVGIVTVEERGLNVGLTTDREVIRAAIKAIVGRAPAAESAEDAGCRTRRVLGELTTLTTRFPPGGAPASVLLFTTGLTPPATSVQMSTVGNINSGPPTPICEVQSRQYQDFQRMLLASAINLHVVEAALAPSQPMRAGLEMLAGVSGNPVAEVVSGVEGALSGLAIGMGAWYRATFVPEPRERTDDVQRVEVVSKRPGVKTEARAQVLIPRPVSTIQPKLPQDMLREARVYRDFELNAAAYFSREEGSDKVKVLILVEPAVDGVKMTAASVGLYDVEGKLVVQGTADAATLTRSPAMLAVLARPGRYRLRVAAINDRGRAGTLDQRVDVALVSAGPVKLSTLVPGIQENGFSGRLQFAGSDTAMAYLAVYDAPATAKLSAQLTIVDAAGTTLGELPTQILDAPDGSHVIIGGLRLASMKPGDYEMKMLIALDGNVVGQAAHTFRRK